MIDFKRVLGFIWSAPVTVVGLLYVCLFTLLGWYKHHGIEGDAIVWIVKQDVAPTWLLSVWKRWAGQTIGNVVVLKCDPGTKLWDTILIHESEHVAQCMRLGIFQPVMYALIYLSIKIACRSADAYFDHSFEVDARRAAGQVIDIVGIVKRAAAEGKLPLKK